MSEKGDMSMTIGERIAARRKEMHMTLKERGDAIGVECSAVSKYEKGRVPNIPPKRIEAIAHALDTTADYLIGLSDNPKQMSLYEYIGLKPEDYIDFNVVSKSEKRKKLESIVAMASEDQLDLLIKLVQAVVNQRKP